MEYIMENQRRTEIKSSCSVLVAGGGIAGISAALAARRNGADVLLVEKGCILGGLATAGLVTVYLPLCDGEGNQLIYGIGEELLRLSIKYGAEARYPKAWLEGGTIEEKCKTRFLVQFNPHLFALSAEELLIKEGVKILYDTVICDVNKDGDKIDVVIVENKGGRSAIRVKNVIDATGDADICKFAGEKTKNAEVKNYPASWYYYFSKGNVGLKMLGLSAANAEEQEILSLYSGIDGEDNTRMLLKSHGIMLNDFLDFRKDDETFVPVTMPSIPQFRMTRRLDGKYTMDDTEVRKHFSDSVGAFGDWRKRGPAYELPYSTLYGNNIKNLITAGRCISVAGKMWDITRVIPVCAVTGQAAGVAAALTDDFDSLDVTVLQTKLKEQGSLIKL